LNEDMDDTSQPIIVTPAATMVIFHHDGGGGPPKLLMMERTKTMAFAGGAAVFPGGKVDAADVQYAQELQHGLDIDEAAARIAAIRETIEEAGLALALRGVDDPANCDEARRALHDGTPLSQVCAAHGWTPHFDMMVPWARWKPPSREVRVFDTRFYLVDAGGTRPDAIVDATENTSLFWASAREVLDMADARKIKIIFPTRRNLERLALFESYTDAVTHAAQFPVETVLTYMEQRGDEQWLCIPDRHGYPVLAEPLSSALRG
jgi:8-oxo-dGTP pyrophosphatase MutT (NUDIX family)